jgi:hypothetical protein
VFAALADQSEKNCGSGQRAIFPEGSETGERLINLAKSDVAHRDMPWPDVAKEAHIEAARSTIERLFHRHHYFRYKARSKPPCSEDTRHGRVQLAELGLTIDQRRIVFTDEMWQEFNSPRRQNHQTRQKGENAYDVARTKEDNKINIRVMFAGAINLLLGTGCGYIYPKTTAADKTHQQEVQKEVNEERQEKSRKRARLAEIPGTNENKEVARFNEEIDRQNAEEGRTGRHKKRHRKPTQVFKAEEIKVTTKGGINWVAYREQFLQPLLYPWIKEKLQPRLLEETGDDTVWLVLLLVFCHPTKF